MEDLFRLIKSMDTEEKRYFRRFGLKDDSKGKSQTEKLFDLLDETVQYNEEQLAFRLKREKLDKQLASLKSYLYERLLDSLLWYRKHSTPGLSNAFELAKIGLLEDRGLQQEADKLTRKMLPAMLQSSSFTDQWNALGKYISEASNAYLSHGKVDFEEVEDKLNARRELLLQMERFSAYDSLLMQQLKIMRKAMLARNEEELQPLNEIFNNPLVQDRTLANSPEAMFIYYTLRIHHFSILHKAQEHYNDAVDLLKYTKTLQVGWPVMRLLWTYAQVTQTCYALRQWHELQQYLQELKEVEAGNQVERMAQFTYHTQLAITLYDHHKNATALLETLLESKKRLAEFGNRLRPDIRLSITITVASAYVEYGHYSEAVSVCEDFLTHYEAGIRLDALLLLHAYELVAHLETGNMLYVNNVVRNIHRYFQRHDFKGPFETTLMNAFRKLSEISDYKAHKEELLKLQTELTQTAGAAESAYHTQLLPLMQAFLQAKSEGLAIHRFVQNQKQA